jgi:hypothetical protein
VGILSAKLMPSFYFKFFLKELPISKINIQSQSSVMAVEVRQHLLTVEVELSGTKSNFLLIRIVDKFWPYKCK